MLIRYEFIQGKSWLSVIFQIWSLYILYPQSQALLSGGVPLPSLFICLVWYKWIKNVERKQYKWMKTKPIHNLFVLQSLQWSQLRVLRFTNDMRNSVHHLPVSPPHATYHKKVKNKNMTRVMAVMLLWWLLRAMNMPKL